MFFSVAAIPDKIPAGVCTASGAPAPAASSLSLSSGGGMIVVIEDGFKNPGYDIHV